MVAPKPEPPPLRFVREGEIPGERPASWQVAIAAVCATGCVVSFARGRLNAEYVWWLALFLTLELSAAVSRQRGDTLSERFWAWTGIRPRRPGRWIRLPLAAPFPFELAAHLVSGGAYPWTGGLAVVMTAVPLAAVVAWSLAFDHDAPKGVTP